MFGIGITAKSLGRTETGLVLVPCGLVNITAFGEYLSRIFGQMSFLTQNQPRHSTEDTDYTQKNVFFCHIQTTIARGK